MKFKIAKPDDVQEIKQLFTDVFTDSEGREEGELIGNLAFELQETTAADDIFVFIAKDEGNIIGCIIFTRLTFEMPVDTFILAPVAIATQYQKQGIGQALIKFGMNYLKSKNVELLFTYGDPNYYSKVGFKPITEEVAKAPLKLTYPQGWLAQSLVGDKIEPIKGRSTCVNALSDQRYW